MAKEVASGRIRPEAKKLGEMINAQANRRGGDDGTRTIRRCIISNALCFGDSQLNATVIFVI